MDNRVIAIDGPAASGKSTTARAVAERLGFAHLDSGALYRAVTLAAVDAAVESSGQRLVALAQSLPVRLRLAGQEFRPEVAGVDVTAAVRSDRVTQRVSQVSALPEVRDWVTGSLRATAALGSGGVVVDGRDIGSVVFPEAPVKVYLTATSHERARRRLTQLGRAEDEAAVLEAARAIDRRDAHDAGRAVAPLTVPADAVVIDTTGMPFTEQVERIVDLARKALGSLDTIS